MLRQKAQLGSLVPCQAEGRSHPLVVSRSAMFSEKAEGWSSLAGHKANHQVQGKLLCLSPCALQAEARFVFFLMAIPRTWSVLSKYVLDGRMKRLFSQAVEAEM